MSANNTTVVIVSGWSDESLIVAYYALTLIIVGTIFNILTFIILCRATFRDGRARSTLHYMRAMAVFDILMLYGWNLDHYLSTVYDFHILRHSIISCRLLSFLSYFAPQSTAWLRVFVCLDRYLLLSRVHRTWFGRPKSVLIIIACIMITLLLLNCQFFIVVCFYRPDGTISARSWLYNIYPSWDYVNLGVYNCAPFALMIIFNSGVIYNLIRRRQTRTIRISQIQNRTMSITLVITTLLFLLMTVPATVAFAFFSSADITILRLLDGLLYTYHVLSFPLYMITFDDFRRECVNILYKIHNPRVQPMIVTATHASNRA